MSLIFNDGSGEASRAAVPDSEVHAKWAENKLRPTSFRWYQQLEPVGNRVGAGPDAERRIEQVADEKRRANCYYSDLFGRETPMDYAQATGVRHAKRVAPEDRITVHGDWSDARTELERGKDT